jgi:hypothetical protein
VQDSSSQLLFWCDEVRAFQPADRNEELGAVLVADSFLVEDGQVRGWEEHRLRFNESCLLASYTPDPDVHPQLANALPGQGRWFPRLELVESGDSLRLRLHVRRAPSRCTEIAVWPVRPSQALRSPRLKGPDLRFLVALRTAAKERGAHEALMLDARGLAVEGALSNLMWWDGDVLCAVPDEAPILPGVTRALLLRVAAADAQPVRFAVPRLEDLRDREVWLTNSLHGISRVVAWTDGTGGTFEAARAERWYRRLDAFARPIPSRANVGVGDCQEAVI